MLRTPVAPIGWLREIPDPLKLRWSSSFQPQPQSTGRTRVTKALRELDQPDIAPGQAGADK